MKYVCSICGYVYDDAVESIAFDMLPDDWTCPSCGAEKAMFDPVEEKEEKRVSALADEDGHSLRKLPPRLLATVFSNLARACRKMYDSEGEALYAELAAFFTPASAAAGEATLDVMVADDIDKEYPALKALASSLGDRGALRALTWGEKVTRIHRSLLSQLEKQGEAFARDTSVWLCTACGFVFIGDNAPERCPVCKVPSWLFEEVK